MSLHWLLNGRNVGLEFAISFIELEFTSIPRYRDVYLKDNFLVIYTRTGGGNREEYDSEMMN